MNLGMMTAEPQSTTVASSARLYKAVSASSLLRMGEENEPFTPIALPTKNQTSHLQSLLI